MQAILASFRGLDIASMMLRIVLALHMGGLIGLDRERKGRPAGFRTYMLVALGAAVTAILSQYLDLMLKTQWSEDFAIVGQRTDLVRLSANVISGIGFIGTGTIMVTDRKKVKGLTTASCLWTSACAGLAIGAGFYECMLIGFVLVTISMQLLPKLEVLIVSKSRNMHIYVELASAEHLGGLIRRMKDTGMLLYEVDIDKSENGSRKLSATFSVHLQQRQQHTELLAKISMLDGILAVEEV
ncbi:MAG: MgtC/SapB family protein [Oscillospiraceae bacterium]|nr:MgtC/SapB family protein [Oscillospiraceae bacterium]